MQNKLSTYALYALLVWAVVVFGLGFFAESYTPMIISAYIFVVISLIGTLAGSVFGLIHKPQAIKTIGIGLVALIVLGGVAYGIADDTVTVAYEQQGIDGGTAKMAGAQIYLFYFMFFLAIIAIIYSSVARLINR